MQIAEFFAKIGVKTDTKGLKVFSGELQDLSKKTALVTGAIIGLAVVLDRVAQSSIKNAVSFRNFNNQTGIAIQRLQELQVRAKLANIELSFDEIASSIQSVQQNLAQIRLGGGDVAPFQLLGINIKDKDAIDIITEDLPRALKDIDRATAVNLIERIGLNRGFINLLDGTGDALFKIDKSEFLSQRQIDNLIKLGSQLTVFRIRLSLLRDRVLADFAPKFEASFGRFKRLFEGLNVVIVDFTNGVLNLKKVTVIAFGLIAAAINPVATAIAAIALALDDLIAFFEGEDSLFGKISEFINKLDLGFIEELAGRLAIGGIGGTFGGLAPLNMTNTFNINTTEDAQALANNIVNKQQTQFNRALDEINNGPKV